MLTAEQKRLIYGEIQEIREERDYASLIKILTRLTSVIRLSKPSTLY